MFRTQNISVDFDVTSDQLTRDANREFIYDYKHVKKNVGDEYIPMKDASIGLQRLEKIAEKSNIKTEDLLEDLKNSGNIDNWKINGAFSEKQRLQMLQDERDVPSRQR